MTEKKTAEEYVSENWGEEWLIHDWQAGDVISAIKEYAAQQSKMPTREECDKKMFEILSQPTSLGKDLRGVRSPAMMMAEYSEWLRNQINK